MKKYLISFIIFCLVIGYWRVNQAHAATFSLAQTPITNSETSGTGTYTVGPFGSAITVGNTIFCVVTLDDGPGDVTNVQDSKGNTFTMDLEADSATPRAATIWRAPVTTGGTSDTVTVTYNAAASTDSGVSCQEWSDGNSGALAVDKTATGAATNATNVTASSTATTVGNEFIVVGDVTTSTNTTCTAGTYFSNASFKAVSNANNCMESAEVSVTGTQKGTLSWTTSRAYGIGLVTYYVNSGGGRSSGTEGKVLITGKVKITGKTIIY